MGLSGLNQVVCRVVFLREAAGENLFRCLFQLLEASLVFTHISEPESGVESFFCGHLSQITAWEKKLLLRTCVIRYDLPG